MSDVNELFDISGFLFSAKGRLNRLPYNIASLSIFFISILLMVALIRSTGNVNNNIYQAKEREASIECSSKMQMGFGPENNPTLQANLMKSCVGDLMFKKMLFATPLNIILTTLLFLFPLLLICPQIRRLHDLGLSGWCVLGVWLSGIIPFIGGIVGLVFFCATTFLPGVPGNNKYGPPPV